MLSLVTRTYSVALFRSVSTSVIHQAFCIPSARREVSWSCDVVITKLKEQKIEKKLNIRPKPQQ